MRGGRIAYAARRNYGADGGSGGRGTIRRQLDDLYPRHHRRQFSVSWLPHGSRQPQKAGRDTHISADSLRGGRNRPDARPFPHRVAEYYLRFATTIVRLQMKRMCEIATPVYLFL